MWPEGIGGRGRAIVAIQAALAVVPARTSIKFVMLFASACKELEARDSYQKGQSVRNAEDLPETGGVNNAPLAEKEPGTLVSSEFESIEVESALEEGKKERRRRMRTRIEGGGGDGGEPHPGAPRTDAGRFWSGRLSADANATS